ncbi:MAG: ROK family protein, partial [Bacilli bacterium]|nr:ROK family protein [Bacilli bacterium]
PTILDIKDDFVNSIISGIEDILKEDKDVIGISIGIPGPVLRESYVITLPNIHIDDIPLGEILNKKFNLPIIVRNDAEMAAFAEAFLGHGKKHSRVFFVTISTGLGGALVVDLTFDESPYEIGHTPYKHLDLTKSFEYFSSGNGLVNLAKVHDLEINNSEHFFALVEEKNVKALFVYGRWLHILTDFLTYIERKYHPSIYVLTGGVFQSKDVFWKDLVSLNPQLNLRECYFKDLAGLIGAAAYGFRRLSN